MQNLLLSNRANAIQPSPTIAITNRARELKARGVDVISLSAGEPDFPTPEHIKQAAIAAIENNDTRYTAVDGTPSLKEAIVEKLKRENGLSYENDNISVSVGAKHCIYNVLQSIINDRSEVIIPAPYWVSYPDMVQLCDGKPVIIHAGIDQRFKISAGQLEDAINENTRLLILNSPGNPTGVMYSREELKSLAAVLKRHPRVLILTDDIYEHILWSEEPFCNIAMADPGIKDQCIVVNGVSKAYAMTGWRIGYAAAPDSLARTMRKIQSQCTSNPCSVSQAAAAAALSGDQGCLKPMVEAFRQRHDFVVGALNQVPGVNCLPADGTFYAFPDFSEIIKADKRFENDLDLAEGLLNEARVAVVPGSAFGGDGKLRLSYATDMASLEIAMQRIAEMFC